MGPTQRVADIKMVAERGLEELKISDASESKDKLNQKLSGYSGPLNS